MGKNTILVVEDNMTDFESLKTLLENNNYLVCHAKTGEATFTLLEQYTPDMVILDILLPDTDGFEVCKKIRKDERFINLPVLFYSVIRTIDDKLLGLEMGAADFLPKSAQQREVLTRIKNLLKNKQQLDTVIKHPLHDSLTEVYNQKYFQDRFQKECIRSQRYDRQLSFAIIDVDKFKLISGTFGEHTANSILKKVAEVIRENTRKVDEVCRYGLDTFGILFPETNLRDAYFAAERVRQLWDNSEIGKQLCTVPVTVSCGVSTFTKDTNDMQDLISQTNAALKRAKEQGKNQTRSYSKQFGYG
ncbi:MAG: diguanylate cyclase [Candidatus Omnitrophota bacterium]